MAKSRGATTKAALTVPKKGASSKVLPPKVRKFGYNLSKDPARAREFLANAGIVTKAGRLTAKYR
jgi:hypothetical protein